MAAYLADEEVEVYNIADVAVRQDAIGLALNLIALGATAVAALAWEIGKSGFCDAIDAPKEE